jgi:hypothetical protein
VAGEVGRDDVPSGGGEGVQVPLEVDPRTGEPVDEEQRSPAGTTLDRGQARSHGGILARALLLH